MTTVRVEQTRLLKSEVHWSGRGTERDRQRFLDKVHVDPSGCWLWQGSLVWGYGQLYFEGRPQKAHRIAWTLMRGDIPDGLWVLHKCDVTACVNPDHLFIGDAYDNHRDMTQKGRARVGVGSRSGMARLNETKVEAILLLLGEGIGVSPIATCLGVSMQTICAIRDGRSWTHVNRKAVA